MYIATGQKTKIRGLLREDVDKMHLWSTHTEPLFFHYNFPKMSQVERDSWYRVKTVRWKKKSYAIENTEGHVIGYLLIRDIQWFRRESELGIVLDPQYMSQGYGTDALQAFLHFYFTKMNMQAIRLRTAKYNTRAQRCYEKCGFKAIEEQDFAFEDQYAEIFYKKTAPDIKKLFTFVDGIIMTRYTVMRMTKKDYAHAINSLSTKIMCECE